MQYFVRFWRKYSVISFLYEICRRFRAHFTLFLTQNEVQDTFCVDPRPTAGKMQPFVRFWRKLSVISFLHEIFRRFRAHFTLFYTSNLVHVAFWVETSPTAGKMQSFIRFWRKLRVISFLHEIFRRASAHFTLSYTQNVVQDTIYVETSPTAGKMQSFVRFWRK
jgi:hypothetical protein